MGSIATIYRPTYIDSPLGNSTTGRPTLLTTCACDIWPINNAGDNPRTNQDIGIAEYYISVPWNQDVELEDFLVIDDILYQITFVPKGMSWLTNKRLEAKNYNNQEFTLPPESEYSLDFSKSKNSMYFPLLYGGLLGGGVLYTPGLNFNNNKNSMYVPLLYQGSI